MIHRGTRKKVYDKLTESLASATRGSRELDIVLSYLMGDATTDAGRLIELFVEEGYSWAVIAELLDEELPPYTTSLDAGLPGEDIALALRSARRGKWAALQRGTDGRETLAWAMTEPLARRLAALKALGPGRSRPSAAPTPAPAAQPEPRTAQPAGESPVAEEEEPEEWKILF